MKNTVVVYESRYGSTERYAKWIGEELDCKVVKISDIKFDDLLNYDTIIYGGWLHAGFIKGFKNISKEIDKIKDKRLIVFSVGLSTPRKEVYEEVEKNNLNGFGDVKHFYLRGAFNYKNLTMIDKLLMNMMKLKLKSIKEEDMDEDAKGMLEAYTSPIDFTDKENIKDLLEYVNA